MSLTEVDLLSPAEDNIRLADTSKIYCRCAM